MKKVLILASVASMIDQFNMPNIALLQEMGYAVEVACNFKEGNTCSGERIEQLKQKLHQENVAFYQIDFARNVMNVRKNRKAFQQVKKILVENRYEFLHGHSPIGGVAGRAVGKMTGTKVIYTAHGFHFFKGAPLKNWLLYYPVEKFLSRWTDVLITINKEDYALAKKKFHAKKTVYVPGVGVDLDKFSLEIHVRQNKRKELGIDEKYIWILAVGELSHRKNHEVLIKAVAQLDNVYCTIAGTGNLKEYLQELIRTLGAEDRVKLLGFREDIPELCEACDVFAFPSLQEGLPVALMEAMAAGKPVVCSRIRGNTDLIDEGKGGYFFYAQSVDSVKEALEKTINAGWKEMGSYNREKMKAFDGKKIRQKMKELYAAEGLVVEDGRTG